MKKTKTKMVKVITYSEIFYFMFLHVYNFFMYWSQLISTVSELVQSYQTVMKLHYLTLYYIINNII